MCRDNCHPEPRFCAKDLPKYLWIDRWLEAFQSGFVEELGEDFHDRNIAAGPSQKTAQDDRFFYPANFPNYQICNLAHISRITRQPVK
jgi:hypothetical protein